MEEAAGVIAAELGTAGKASKISFSKRGEGSVDSREETDIQEVGLSLGMFMEPNPM